MSRAVLRRSGCHTLRALFCACVCAVLAACATAPAPHAQDQAAPTDAAAPNEDKPQSLPAQPAGAEASSPPVAEPASPAPPLPSEEPPKEEAPGAPESPGQPAPPATAEPAAPSQAPGTPPATEPRPGEAVAPPAEENLLEQTRRSVRSTAMWLARGVDSWFGDKPFEQGGKVTDGRLGLSLLKREDTSLDFKVRFNARFRLPNVEERTYFFLGRDNDRETVADTPGALSRQERLQTETPEDRTFFAGFGYALREAFDLRLGFHGIKPYAQARYRGAWNITQRDLAEFRQTFFWRVRDHFGSTTALSYEHAYSSTLAFRWLSATTATQKSHQFDWSSLAGLYKGFPGEQLLSLEYVLSGAQHTGMLVSEHGAQAKWSQPIYRDWLFAEVITGLYWPRRALFESRDRVWALGASLTMRF